MCNFTLNWYKAIYIREFLTHAEYDKDKWKNDEWFDS
jgi:mRNA interferase HigB